EATRGSAGNIPDAAGARSAPPVRGGGWWVTESIRSLVRRWLPSAGVGHFPPPTPHPPHSDMSRVHRNLTVQVLVAISFGILLGLGTPSVGRAMRPVGETFVNLVRMII